jgi:hypothetical protein
MFKNHEQTSDTAARIVPKIKAFFGDILPDGIGRPLVRSIIASMSRSLYPVKVSAAADPAATPTINRTHIRGEVGISNRKDAVRAEAKAVKTKRYHIFGFVSS